MVCVAPSSLASASLESCRSIAAIVVAPAMRAAMTAARPTAPARETAAEEPAGGSLVSLKERVFGSVLVEPIVPNLGTVNQ